MAASKRKTKAATRNDKYTAELSSGQLVIGVGILLVFGLACFLLGVLIGKFDPTLQQEMANSREPDIRTTQPSEKSALESTPQEPEVTRKELPPEMRVPTKKIPAVKKKSTPTKTSTTIPNSARKKVAASPASPAPKKPPTHAPEEEEAPSKPIKAASESLPNEPIPAPPKSVAKPTMDWYIQIGAFKIKTNAEKERVRLQSKLPYSLSLLSIPNNNYVKVIIGEFPTRDAAEKVKKELLTQYGFKEALIKKREGGV